MNLFQDILLKYKQGNVVVKIIFLVVLFNFSLTLVDFIFFRENRGFLTTAFSLSSSSPFLTAIFSVFTYAFISKEIISLFFNLLALYYIGNLFLSHFREKDFLTFFFLGIIGGGIVYLLLSFFLGNGTLLAGFSPTIFCLLFAVVSYQPKINVKLLFINIPIQLQHIGYGLIALQFLVWIFRMEDITPLVNIGAAAIGYFYMKQFELGNDFIGSLLAKLKFKSETTAKKFNEKPPSDDFEYQEYKAEKQKKLDEILEKISAKGYDSLTKEEKEFLFKASK